MIDQRPKLNKNISIKDFNDFYWLKNELIDFCRKEKLKLNGSKTELSERIVYYLATGKQKKQPQTITSKSKFDWNAETLTLETVITDNYKNTENVRLFFESIIGKQFKFNVVFMNWIKSNIGQTMQNAVDQYKKIQLDKKHNTQTKSIEPQFEYNTYLRDFLADNPNLARNVGIQLWNIKKTLRGNNIYAKKDLTLI